MARVLLLASRLAAGSLPGSFVTNMGRIASNTVLLLGIITSGTISLMPTPRSMISTANQTWGTGRNNLSVLPDSAA